LATITEVARHAGVGVATVSRVLNGSPAVREETRRRVLAAIAELSYAPNPAARALSTGRTLSIGVVAPFFTRPSVMERLRGVARVLAAAGYQLVLFDVERPGQDWQSFRTLPSSWPATRVSPPSRSRSRRAARAAHRCCWPRSRARPPAGSGFPSSWSRAQVPPQRV
jgi:DNA-binding LacI/PurR family transcriptional regulator